jgi:hypothetical protein
VFLLARDGCVLARKGVAILICARSLPIWQMGVFLLARGSADVCVPVSKGMGVFQPVV